MARYLVVASFFNVVIGFMLLSRSGEIKDFLKGYEGSSEGVMLDL